MQETHAAWAGLLILIPLLLIGLAMLAFWIWMLVDCLKNEGLQGNEKIIWVLHVRG